VATYSPVGGQFVVSPTSFSEGRYSANRILKVNKLEARARGREPPGLGGEVGGGDLARLLLTSAEDEEGRSENCPTQTPPLLFRPDPTEQNEHISNDLSWRGQSVVFYVHGGLLLHLSEGTRELSCTVRVPSCIQQFSLFDFWAGFPPLQVSTPAINLDEWIAVPALASLVS